MNEGYIRPVRSFRIIRAELNQTLAGDGVIIRYAQRQPAQGLGSIHGIRCPCNLALYKRALEWTLYRLASPPINLPPPRDPLAAWCFDIGEWKGEPEPFTFDEAGRPAIALPSRTTLATLELERQHMAAAAVHEMTHAVCATLPGMGSVRRLWAGDWHWIAEATSIWMETRIASQAEAAEAGLPQTYDGLVYALDWCDYPEAPLDAPQGRYQSAQFLRYLVNILGERFIGDLWKEGRADAPAWPIIERLTGKPVDDLFIDYASQAYCLNDSRSACYFPEIYERFGGRRITESWLLSPGQTVTAGGEVWPLGCRYFRVCYSGSEDLAVRWDGNGASAIAVGSASSDHKRVGETVVLRQAGNGVVKFGGAVNHVWIAVCGKAGTVESRFSFSVSSR